jgi:hypothetical protein
VGKIVVTITKPDGNQLTDMVEFEILPALEERTKKAERLVPQFEVIPINPTDDPVQWAAAWPHLGDDASDDDLASVAYKPVSVG